MEVIMKKILLSLNLVAISMVTISNINASKARQAARTQVRQVRAIPAMPNRANIAPARVRLLTRDLEEPLRPVNPSVYEEQTPYEFVPSVDSDSDRSEPPAYNDAIQRDLAPRVYPVVEYPRLDEGDASDEESVASNETDESIDTGYVMPEPVTDWDKFFAVY